MKAKKLGALFLALSLVTACFTGCGQEVKYADNLDAYVKTMDYVDGFTILQFTDIHWNGSSQIGDDTYGCKAYLKKVIDEAKAHAGKIDLIEITGDTFMLANKRAVRSFIDFMEEMQIPYAMVWGNHDRESTFNPNWISEQFMNAPYCLYTEVDNDDVHERCNYVINLTSGEDVVWQLVQLDSGASYRKGAADMGMTYDYIRPDQYEWMKAEHEAAGSDVPVICYYHIPQAECKEALAAIENNDPNYSAKFFKLEGIGSSKFCESSEPYFVENNVKAAFYGHDHNDDWTYTSPNGIVYGFGVKTGKELYSCSVPVDYEGSGVEFNEEFDLIGASLVTLNNAEGDFTLEHLYLNERDGGDFVMWVEY